MDATKYVDEILFDHMDRSAEADDLEALVADIKATVYSPFQNDWMKLKFIKKAIEEAGY
jgi:hypothetical protein